MNIRILQGGTGFVFAFRNALPVSSTVPRLMPAVVRVGPRCFVGAHVATVVGSGRRHRRGLSAKRSASPNRWDRCASTSTARVSATRSRRWGKNGAFPPDQFTKVAEANLIGTSSSCVWPSSGSPRPNPPVRSAASSSTPRRSRNLIRVASGLARHNGALSWGTAEPRRGLGEGQTEQIRAGDGWEQRHPRRRVRGWLHPTRRIVSSCYGWRRATSHSANGRTLRPHLHAARGNYCPPTHRRGAGHSTAELLHRGYESCPPSR